MFSGWLELLIRRGQTSYLFRLLPTSEALQWASYNIKMKGAISASITSTDLYEETSIIIIYHVYAFKFCRMQQLAKELAVVIPMSFFEEENNAHYNSVAIIYADGLIGGLRLILISKMTCFNGVAWKP
ncbi:hypothetical protein ZIOFF_023535 [Zingiber officinale]|uniref:Uncharacterized protein n=1 Tax=Zingiber officinale TaxID=94328 RepID=A0A8J5GWW8_ZINOF|nr:hypothetical protein ZIOFF_023535 [Zingiber officinale]